MTENFVAHRLLIDYSLNIGYIQWLINWLLINFLLMTHWFHWCHQLVTYGKQLSYRPNTLFVDEFLWSLAQYLRKWSSKVHFQALFSHSSGQFLMSSKFSHTNGIFLPKKQGEEKWRPMNICAFFGVKTTEYESVSAQQSAWQGAKKSKQRGQILILGNFFFRNILVDGGEFGVVQSFFTQCCAFIKDAAVSCAVNVRVLVMPREFTWEKILSMDIASGKSVDICRWPNEH